MKKGLFLLGENPYFNIFTGIQLEFPVYSETAYSEDICG